MQYQLPFIINKKHRVAQEKLDVWPLQVKQTCCCSCWSLSHAKPILKSLSPSNSAVNLQ